MISKCDVNYKGLQLLQVVICHLPICGKDIT